MPRPCERDEWATKTSWESREGFSSGGRGGMGRGRDADQRLQWKGVAEQAMGGSETVDATKGQRGQGMSPCLTPLQDISLYTAGPVHWVPYNEGRPGRHGSPLPGGLTMATLSGGGGLYLEPGVPTRPASV